MENIRKFILAVLIIKIHPYMKLCKILLLHYSIIKQVWIQIFGLFNPSYMKDLRFWGQTEFGLLWKENKHLTAKSDMTDIDIWDYSRMAGKQCLAVKL